LIDKVKLFIKNLNCAFYRKVSHIAEERMYVKMWPGLHVGNINS